MNEDKQSAAPAPVAQPADLRERLEAAHEASIDGDDRACQAILRTLIQGLPAAPAPVAQLTGGQLRAIDDAHDWRTTAGRMAAYRAVESFRAPAPVEPTDAQIEAVFIGSGGRWDGSRWIIEDADLHPMARRFAAPAPVAQSDEAKWTESDLWAEVHRLRAEVAGPDGFATWKDAAVAERVRRVRAEAAAPAPAPVLTQPHPAIAQALDALEKAGKLGFYANKARRILREATGQPAAPVLTPAQALTDELRRFLDVAAGEGYVLDGVDAGELFLALFPDHYKATGQEGSKDHG